MSKKNEEAKIDAQKLLNELEEIRPKFNEELGAILQETGGVLIPVIRVSGPPDIDIGLNQPQRKHFWQRSLMGRKEAGKKLQECLNRLKVLQLKYRIDMYALITESGAKWNIRWNAEKLRESQKMIITPPDKKLITVSH